MKNLLKLTLLLALGFGFNACSDEEEEPIKDTTPTCKQADWLGTYNGIMNCGGEMDTTVFTITASGSDAIVMKYEQENSFTEYDPITPSGCKLDQTTSEAGLTLSVSASIEGNKLMFTEIFTFDGESDTCVMTGIRK